MEHVLLHVQQLLERTLRAQLATCLETCAFEQLAARFLDESANEKPTSPAPQPAPSAGALLFKNVEAAYDLYDKYVVDVLMLEAGVALTKYAENGSNATSSNSTSEKPSASQVSQSKVITYSYNARPNTRVLYAR